MKYLAILLLAGFMTSCGFQEKSEEAVVLTIDTASMLKGRAIQANISIKNDKVAEHIPGRR